MISVAEIVVDADLGGQAFFVHRYQNQGSFQLGGYVETPTVIPMFGVIQPASEEQLKQVSEGDRVEGSLAIWCPQQIYRTTKSGTSDIILWQAWKYRVSGVWRWNQANYYHAIAVRIEGD